MHDGLFMTPNEAPTPTSTAVSATASRIEVPLTAAQLAPLIHLHRVTVLRWAKEGRIPCRRLSARKVLFIPSEVNRWLSSGYTELATRAAQL